MPETSELTWTSKLRQYFWQPMTPSQRLFRTRPFQASLFIPILISAALALCINCSEGLSFNFSARGIENLWQYHKLSLAILGVIFPATALVASHHRSIQSAEQITQQNSQNLLSNHFRHVEEFVKAWEEQTASNSKNSSFSLRALHHSIFPNTLNGDFRISQEWADSIRNIIQSWWAAHASAKNNEPVSYIEVPLKHAQQCLQELAGIETTLHGRLEEAPFSTVKYFVRSQGQSLKQIIEAVSFLPHLTIRPLESDINQLIKVVEKDASFMEPRQSLLNQHRIAIKRSIEDIEAIEPLFPSRLKHKVDLLDRDCRALMCSDQGFTFSELRFWCPSRELSRVTAHLSPEVNEWLQRI